MQNGMKIMYKNKGKEYPDCEKGDIIFIISEKKHKNFIRLNNNNKYDLYYKKSITLIEALIGSKIIIEHLDKRKIYFELKDIIKPNTFKKISGEGLLRGKSDLIIEFDIKFPIYIDKKYKDQLENIFNQKINNNFIDNGAKEVSINDFNQSLNDINFNRNMNMESDSDNENFFDFI
jgi:DnaJ-class molecular chaperone